MNVPNISHYSDKPNAWSSHSIIIRRLCKLNIGEKVLDVGTATGTIGRMCNNANLELNGVEPSSEWAKLAEPYYNAIIIQPIESCPDLFLSNYKAVILADILEHTVKPEVVLQRLVSLQTNDCLFIISVPNIANIWIRITLLLGRFNYTERGILDRTHLRFFTRKTIIALIEDVELKVNKISVTPIPLDLISPFFTKTNIGRLMFFLLYKITKLFPTLFGYQFVIEAIR